MTTSNNTPVLIKDLKPGMNNLHLTFIVLDICRPITTKENQVLGYYFGEKIFLKKIIVCRR